MRNRSPSVWGVPLPCDDITLLTAVLFLSFVGLGTTGPTLSIYLEALGADFRLISVILTSSGLLALTGHYGWGRLSDRWGRRQPIVAASLFALGLALFLLSRAASYPMVWGIQLGQALALSAYSTVSWALIGDWLARDVKQGRRLGTYRGFGSVAFAAGAFVSGFIVNRLGVQQAYVFASGVYLLAGVCSLPVREAPASGAAGDPPGAEADGRLHWRRPATLAFLGGVALWSTAHSAQASMFPNFITHLGLPEAASSWLWGGAALVEGLLMPVIGILSDAFGSLALLVSSGLSLGLVMAGYLGLRGAQISPLLLGAQLARGWGFASYTVTSMMHAALLGNRRTRAGNVGIYSAAMSTGNIMGLAAGGQLVQERGFGFLFACCAACYVASSLLFWSMRRKATRGPAPAGD